ncbi:stage V sporulation protein B [Anaerotaenia torta]|uniref:putative polysaccharide biosynthesis protein n=1 Tax=Anaerotaenia torta TaxID=433293 RepID=UPI003D1D39D5
MNHTPLTASELRKMKRNTLVKGTLILTAAGFATRFAGFFYRIFLSNSMGAELLGIYQLIFPVYTICYTIYATGIQTSISRLVAAELGRRNSKNISKILWTGLILSISLAVILSITVYFHADFIAGRFLMEARSTEALRILAVVFPFCGVTACINGYYYGLKRAGIPASTQLLEQVVRIVIVYLVALYAGGGEAKVTLGLAVFGLVIGEVASSLYNLCSLLWGRSPGEILPGGPDPRAKTDSPRQILKSLLSLSVPLSANRLLLSILHSIEAILIPAMLRRFGLTTQEAMTTFGILNGMSIPFIMFPTALINALAVLILPTISEAQAVSNDTLIGKTSAVAVKYSLMIGIVSTGLFLLFGKDLGNTIFHNEQAGSYLMTLAWLCPLIYLTTTLSSIINGLGKAHITFANSIISSLCKILLVAFLIPSRGIKGYLIALLIGQLIVTGLDAFAVMRNVRFSMNGVDSIVKPAVIIALAGFLLKRSYEYIKKMTHINEVLLLLSFCFIVCVICIALLYITKAISRKDFQ